VQAVVQHVPPARFEGREFTSPSANNKMLIRLRHSALTDFLAVYLYRAQLHISVANISQSHNISANQIRQDAMARRAAALASQQDEGDGDENEANVKSESDCED
jgi:hypothetical protein